VPTVLNEKAKKVCAMVPFDSFKTSSLMGPWVYSEEIPWKIIAYNNKDLMVIIHNN
jgi:hypothetical protein